MIAALWILRVVFTVWLLLVIGMLILSISTGTTNRPAILITCGLIAVCLSLTLIAWKVDLA